MGEEKMVLDLDALEALHKAATSGPWARNVGSVAGSRFVAQMQREDGAGHSDARLIAAMHAALPEFLRLARIGQLVEDTYARVVKEGGA